MTFTVAIIKKNKCVIDIPLTIPKNDAITEIIKQIEPYVTTVETTETGGKFLELIADTVGLNNKKVADTTRIHETLTHVYEMCHIEYVTGNKPNPDDINYISSTLTVDKKNIFDDVVFFIQKINSDLVCEPCSITIKNIAELIYSKTVHIGAKITPDNKLTEFVYTVNPLLDEPIANYSYIEFVLFNFNLLMCFENNPTDARTNYFASRLLGSDKVNGSVILVSTLGQQNYTDLQISDVTKMYNVTRGPYIDRGLTTDEIFDSNKKNKDGLVHYINNHIILDKRNNKYVKHCYACNKTLETGSFKMCTGCHRLSYCDEACRVKDWSNHKNDCLYTKSPINECVDSCSTINN